MVLVFKDTSITFPHGMEPTIQGLGEAWEILHRWLVLILRMWIQNWKNERFVGSEIPILRMGISLPTEKSWRSCRSFPMVQHLLVIVQKIFSLEILEVQHGGPDEETLHGMLEIPNQPTYPNSLEEKINRIFQLNLGMLANSEDKDHQLLIRKVMSSAPVMYLENSLILKEVEKWGGKEPFSRMVTISLWITLATCRMVKFLIRRRRETSSVFNLEDLKIIRGWGWS